MTLDLVDVLRRNAKRLNTMEDRHADENALADVLYVAANVAEQSSTTTPKDLVIAVAQLAQIVEKTGFLEDVGESS